MNNLCKILVPLLIVLNTSCTTVYYANDIKYLDFKSNKSGVEESSRNTMDCFALFPAKQDEFTKLIGSESHSVKNLKLEQTSIFLGYGWIDCYKVSEGEK